MRKAFIITFLIIFSLSSVYSYFLTYISNQNLYFTLILLKSAGHIIVPDNSILASMLEPKVILFASFFITFTAGLVVSIFISLLVSIFFIDRDSFLKLVEISIPIIISISLVITTVFIFDKNQLFTRARDSFIFSNMAGKTINEFYYKYTLYASETLQSPMHKQIKPCWVDPKIKENAKIKKELFKYGWLTTDRILNNELVIRQNFQSGLDMLHNNRLLFQVTTEKFLENPSRYLGQFSRALDKKATLRFLCSAGLIPGIPILVFLILHFIIFLLFLSTNRAKKANLIASTVTAILFIGLLFYLNPEIINKPNQDAARNMLFASEPRERIQGLRLVYKNKYEINAFNHIASQLIQGNSTEKYWLATVLGMKKTRDNIKYLKRLIKDESMMVRYAALRSLGQIDTSKRALTIFKQTINNSNSKNNPNHGLWYVQYHAYNAYRTWILNSSKN